MSQSEEEVRRDLVLANRLEDIADESGPNTNLLVVNMQQGLLAQRKLGCFHVDRHVAAGLQAKPVD